MDRPRRSTRPSAKAQAAAQPPSPPPAAAPSRPKRKAQDALTDPDAFLQFLLKSPKSPLTTMDISELVNLSNWNKLSRESRDSLKALLPPTAFLGFKAFVDSDHPSCVAGTMAVDVDPLDIIDSADLDPSVFSDPHFLAAAHTFQDHIYSDWMSDAHVEKVQRYEQGVRDGALSAAWKDEVWERDHIVMDSETAKSRTQGTTSLWGTGSESSARAGEAAEVKLMTLTKNRVIRVGDVIAYKRAFTTADLIIEKDVIVQSIHPKNHQVTVLFPSGTTKHLPSPLLLTPIKQLSSVTPPEPEDSSVHILSATITSPSMLETALLDTDARMEKARRPNGNAWKCFTVYRWRGEEVGDVEDARAGRENHGTLFYLRGTYYHER